MRKLKLALEDLAVDSFATATHAHERGTIGGNAVSLYCNTENTCEGPTCGGVAENTCALSCDTCDHYRCPTGDECTAYLNCLSNNGQCQSGVGCGTSYCGTT
jgi:hypothetical protein